MSTTIARLQGRKSKKPAAAKAPTGHFSADWYAAELTAKFAAISKDRLLQDTLTTNSQALLFPKAPFYHSTRSMSTFVTRSSKELFSSPPLNPPQEKMELWKQSSVYYKIGQSIIPFKTQVPRLPTHLSPEPDWQNL